MEYKLVEAEKHGMTPSFLDFETLLYKAFGNNLSACEIRSWYENLKQTGSVADRV